MTDGKNSSDKSAGKTGDRPIKDDGKTVFVGGKPAPAKPSSRQDNHATKDSEKTLLSPSSSKAAAGEGKTRLAGASTPLGNIKAKPVVRPSANKNPTQARVNTEQVAALTEIRQSIAKQDKDNSQGFSKAKLAADKALASNKIILNRRFVLEKTLGAGGMGTVYKAKDLRKIEANDRNPHVAVKVLNEDFKNHPNAFVTLQREASRSHRLSHPKIVTVHDFDRDGDVIYMTMELLEGEPLDLVIRKRAGAPLSVEQAFPLINDICDALAYAHEKDIIHSDLKPGNIFSTPDSAKILDFGIARLTSNTDDFDSGDLGALTPAYASLEMIEGQEPHPSDDLYAIAVIAYELLTGGHPYDRLPANEALIEQKKLKKPAVLSGRQWAALENALQISREKRTSSVAEFQKAFFEKKKFPLFKVVSALLLLVCAAFVYLFLYVFEDMDSRIEQTLSSAAACMEQKDYDCAIDKYQTVLELQPNHAQAKQLILDAENKLHSAKIDVLLQGFDKCLDVDLSVVCAKAKEQELVSARADEPILKLVAQKISNFEKQQQISRLLVEANSCYETKNFTCANDNVAKVLNLDKNNAVALDLHKKTLHSQSQLNEKSEREEKQYSEAMKKGRNCLSAEDFECAIRHFKAALKLRKRDEAQVLLQSATFKLENKQKDYAKAGRMLGQAQACFDKKKYSCAISKAESAIDIVPGYQKAIKLKSEAEKAQQEAKRSFTIE